MKYSFHPEAEVEYNHTIDYYEDCSKGLGYHFALEVYKTIERINSYPEAWPILLNGVRRSLVKRFPYGVLYTKENDEIFILAIMNLHREPEYWKHRF